MAKAHEVSRPMIARVESFAQEVGICRPVRGLVLGSG